MKKIVMAMALMAFIGVSAMAQRQNMSPEELAARRAEAVERQANQLAKEFNLEGNAKQEFVTTYSAYQSEVTALQQTERMRNDRAENSNDKKLTDEQATKQIEDNFTRQEQQIARQVLRLKIDKKYYEKFQETLTPQQLVKIFVPQRNQRQGANTQRNGFGQQGGQNRMPRNGGFDGEGGFGDGF